MILIKIQGRLPNICETKPLNKEDFIKIMKHSQASALTQSIISLKTEDLHIDFTEKAMEEIANIAEENNKKEEDTGARRLIKIIDKVLEDINYNAPEIFIEYNQPGKAIKY
jgi:ATP-dependent HslUV protease ATP-binding subunit HslU